MTETEESTRMALEKCEREIQKIKAALRQVGAEDGQNSLQVVWVSAGAADTEVSLQLSAPVEEALLTTSNADGNEEGSSTTFAGVESSLATLTVTLRKKDGGEILGTSEAYDLAPVCSLGDPLEPKEEYITELPVAIVGVAVEKSAEDSTPPAAATETDDKESEQTQEEAAKPAAGDEEKPAAEGEEEPKKDDEQDKAEETKKEEEPKKKEEETATVIKPVTTINLRLVFKPSPKDRKEELYELLNKASVRRTQALERHRGQQQQTISKRAAAASPGKKSPAVKAGFLNKKQQKKAPAEEASKWKIFYDKYLGPKSMARGLIIPIAKNYVIFFGAVVLAHFKGQELALPAPV